ncbi:MAG: ATP-dependent DNA helicase [Euryarchaeota archaeon]|nr:ATP-dependent DNA helicase [Euryarchaeota archaeon]
MAEKKHAIFPFPSVRAGQKEFMKDVQHAVDSGGILIAHAPTGIGKTVAVLAPALQYAIENDKTLFFLTSKKSQHKIAIDTLRLLKERMNLDVVAVDITSKQSMCPRAVSIYREFYSLFNEFCKYEQKNKRCRYFMKQDEDTIRGIKEEIMHVEELCSWCTTRGICPYKAALDAGKSADVLVCDYNYLFSHDIAERVLEKTETGLEDIIVIVDEAHNLPDRIRNNLSSELRMKVLSETARGIRATNREMYDNLLQLEMMFKRLTREAVKQNKSEIRVERDFLLDGLESILRRRIDAMSYAEFIDSLRHIAEGFDSGTKNTKNTKYRAEKETLQRNILTMADFFDSWQTEEKCLRIFSVSQQDNPTIFFKLLDPSVVSEPIFAKAHATILMSGTLCPTEMYADILGAAPDRLKGKELVLNEYRSPFPAENRLVVVTKELTTKYTKRGDEMYQNIANKIDEVAKYVIGGMAVFFPSYALLKNIYAYLPDDVRSRAIVEKREMNKDEKNRLYEMLRDNFSKVLLAVQGGSFSEGMDYESNTLKAIIVVGLPLSPPTLEVKTIEGYYIGKYGTEKGRHYGYFYPAITKVLQAAGRGIRSEHDRCIIVLMDYRFARYPYKNCLPPDYDITFTDKAEDLCKDFFKW